MSIQSQFTPAQLQALIAGETVAFSQSSGDAEATPATEIKEKEGHTPASAVKPRTSVPLTKLDGVTPRIKNPSGKVVTTESVSKPSPKAFINIDQENARIKKEALERVDAERQLKELANPVSLLNQLNATRRVVEKLQKEVNALKKKQS